MTSPNQPKQTPIPAVLVYGTPTSPELTQASWFRAEDRQAAMAAAEALKFSVIDIQTDREKALIVGVHEGVLKGSGRMIVGSVAAEVYRRIEDYARKGAGAEASPGSASTEAAAAKPASEQTANSGAIGAPTTSSAPASTASPETDRQGRIYARMVRRSRIPGVQEPAKNIAVPHPEFRVSGK